MDLGSSMAVTMAHVTNTNYDSNWSTSWGNSAFYITDDPAADEISEYTKCSSDFHDSGFKPLANCYGRYLIMAREGSGMFTNEWLVNEVRAYSVINLLEGASVIENPEPISSTFSAENLVENQETRSSG